MTHEKPERKPDELDEYQLRYIIAGAPGLVWIGERTGRRVMDFEAEGIQ